MLFDALKEEIVGGKYRVGSVFPSHAKEPKPNGRRINMINFVSNREIYEQVIRDRVPLARKRLWIVTADIKDMYVDSGGRDMVPFLKVLATLIGKGIEIRRVGH